MINLIYINLLKAYKILYRYFISMDTEIYSYDTDKIRPIERIEFSILGNEEIKNMSALGKDNAGIEIPDLYDNLEPKRGGLIDPRLGTTDSNIDCATCRLNSTYCVGHFGHIDLEEPVFHVGYLPFVKKILSCICLKCSKLLVYKNEEEIAEMLRLKSGKQRMSEIKNLVKNVTYCQKSNYGCGTPVSKIREERKKTALSIILYAETEVKAMGDEGEIKAGDKKKIRQILTPEIVYDILKNISDTDCLILGMDPKRCRPEMMIHKVLGVPPVAIRPSAKADFTASATLEDGLTHKLADIVKANERVKKHKETLNENSMKYSQDHVMLLQYNVATYFDNESLALPKSEKKGTPIKSLSSRQKGKEGRIRGNLMGKRTEYSGRTVITSDPTIDINQLRVPIKIAMNLTYPEVVTPENIKHLEKLVRNGREIYPGANFVFPISSLLPGQRVLPKDLRANKDQIELRYGDVVERHLVDGDIVLFNRQPTLHKQSMMGHRIKVINNPDLNTFGVSVAVTTPYNAD